MNNEQDLTLMVAEKVMGWHRSFCESVYFESWCNEEGVGEGPISQWKPLTDWNATMQVIDKVREQGWWFNMYDRFDDVLASFIKKDTCFFIWHDCEAKRGNERWAILGAALKTVEEEPQKSSPL